MHEWYIQQDFFNQEILNKIYEWQQYAFDKYGKAISKEELKNKLK